MKGGSARRRTPESFVGEQIRNVSLRVEAGKIAEFVSALHDCDTAYHHPPAGERIPAPPTFSVVAGLQNHGVGSPAAEAVAIMSLDRGRTLNGEQEWQYSAPVFAGDMISGATTVTGVDRRTNRQGRQMLLVTLETIWTRADLEVMRETVTIIEMAATP